MLRCCFLFNLFFHAKSEQGSCLRPWLWVQCVFREAVLWSYYGSPGGTHTHAYTFRVRSSGAPAIIQSDCFHISFVKRVPLLCQTIPSHGIDLLQATNPISRTVMCLSHASFENRSLSLCPGLWLQDLQLYHSPSAKNVSIIILSTWCYMLGMQHQNTQKVRQNVYNFTITRNICLIPDDD